MGPALIKGVLLDLHLLLRLSTGKRHVMRAMTRKDLVDPNSHHTNPSRSKLTPLSHEEALERHIRLELLGVPRGKEGGRDPAPHEKKGHMDIISTVANSMGISGFNLHGEEARDPRDAFASAGIGSTPTPLTPRPPGTSPSSPSSSSEEIRTKYLARLREKGRCQGGVQEEGRVGDHLAGGQNRFGRVVERGEGGREGGREGGILGPPVVEMMEWLAWRGLRLGLLPRGRRALTRAALVGGGKGGEGVKLLSLWNEESEVREEEGQEEEGGEEGEVEGEDEKGKTRWRVETEMRRLCEHVQLEPRQLLVVTGEPLLVEVGRGQGCFTCLLGEEGEEGKRKGREDYRIEAWDAVRDVVEDLNGVSYRRR